MHICTNSEITIVTTAALRVVCFPRRKGLNCLSCQSSICSVMLTNCQTLSMTVTFLRSTRYYREKHSASKKWLRILIKRAKNKQERHLHSWQASPSYPGKHLHLP